jgi:hypothetical protein
MDPMRRRVLLQGSIAAAAAYAALFGRRGHAASGTVVESRPVADFDAVVWNLTGELQITQSGGESLSVEAEPSVVARIVTEVRQRRLVVEWKPGSNVQTRLPIRVRVGCKALRSLQLHGSGEARVDALSGADFALLVAGSTDVELAQLAVAALKVDVSGSGDVRFGGGRVERERIAIAGSGDVEALQLACRDADVSISGSGDVQVAASERLAVSISGSGDVRYRGSPQVMQRVTGSGSVQPIGG